MSHKIRLLLGNAINESVLTLATGTEQLLLGLDNLTRYSNSHIFRTETLDEIVIEGRFNGFQALSGFVMHRHNLSATAKYQLEIFSGDKQDGQVLYDTTLEDVFETKLLGALVWGIDDLVEALNDDWDIRYKALWFDPVLAWSFRLTLQDPDNIDGYIDIARLYFGEAFEPSINFSYGSQNHVDADEDLVRTKGSSLHTIIKSKQYRRLAFQFNYLSLDERTLLYDAIYQGTKSKDFFISLYPGTGGEYEHQHAMACKFKSLPVFTHDYENNWQTACVVEEC
ncbi:MAG: hypothetical protein HRT38_02705 [Alteromonadaceae bacterium]|nr:hypothetical protein [Alteromonadaceae bacterium]